jgi:hypothetical protein
VTRATHARWSDTPPCDQTGPDGQRVTSRADKHWLRPGVSPQSDAVRAELPDSALADEVTATCPGEVLRSLPRRKPRSRSPRSRITNTVAPVSRKPDVSTDEPEKNVGVEQEPHGSSNVCRMSSGKDASKSSRPATFPRVAKPHIEVLLWAFLRSVSSATPAAVPRSGLPGGCVSVSCWSPARRTPHCSWGRAPDGVVQKCF